MHDASGFGNRLRTGPYRERIYLRPTVPLLRVRPLTDQLPASPVPCQQSTLLSHTRPNTSPPGVPQTSSPTQTTTWKNLVSKPTTTNKD